MGAMLDTYSGRLRNSKIIDIFPLKKEDASVSNSLINTDMYLLQLSLKFSMIPKVEGCLKQCFNFIVKHFVINQ